MQGAGGTPGGVGAFAVGLGMVVVGAYLLLTRVTVGSGAWMLWGYSAFGMSLLPLLIGIGWLFFDGRSVGGWVLTVMGALIIFAGIIANLHIYFAATSLFDTLVMLALLAGGIGVIARSLKAASASAPGQEP
ncbi:MAG TPA: hypothetical protein VEK77_00030 [Gemmatimonadales bacterium]|nr:hypothetical protein [Gemmatimonadales bacterium]